MNLILCGLPMAGKSTVGKKLSDSLGWDFCDTDLMLEEAHLKKSGELLTHDEIFSKYGDAYFQSLENEILNQLILLDGCVIAIGGAVLAKIEHVEKLKKTGILMYLKVDLDVILDRFRVQSSNDSSFYSKDIEDIFCQLARKKIGIYENCCDLVLDVACGV